MTQSAAVGQAGHRLALRRPRVDGPGLVAWLIPFALVLYLALQNGGYDAVLRNQLGVAVWWIVLLGALVGVLPVVRLNRAGWIGLALLGGFVAWTALSLVWTESDERTMADLGKVAAYLGVFGLALAAQGKAAMRHALNGLTAAIAVVAVLAVGYRLRPEWFSLTDTDRFFATSRNRLNYPLGYWNALAALVAMGVPLAMHAAGTARLLVTRALATATLPVMVLCAFFTISRGGVLMIGAGLAVYLLLAPERLYRLATLAVAAAGSGILIAAAERRTAVKEALATALGREQSDQMLRLVLIVALGVAALQVAVALLERHVGPPPWLTPGRPRARIVSAVGLLLVLAGFAAFGGPGWASDRWQEFRSTSAVPTSSTSTPFSRLSSVSGNGRYQLWEVAARARDESPLHGSGSGTFEFWWSRGGTPGSGFVRDAHSLWMETQGELGWIGFFLIAGFFAFALMVGGVRALREAEPRRRHVYAAAAGGVTAFVIAASVEWVWEMAVLPLIALVLVATLLGGQRPRWVRLGAGREARGRSRLALAALALPALVAIAIPLAETTALRDSQAAARDGALGPALRDARAAAAIQPSAASPYVQQALVFERAGHLGRAAQDAVIATRNEPTNWRPWLILSRIEARRDRPAAALAAFRRARSLNRRSVLFVQP